ncbi:MAG: hypothetical protein M0R39_02070 [Prolixibacteraceae bacterium]|nr:hypothetical protein [Prolixibacteraceae bacterium]
MKVQLILVMLFVSIFAIAQNENHKIENHWFNLTNKNGKLVLFERCDAEIPQIIIDPEKREMTMKYGNEDAIFKINNTTYISDKELNINIIYSIFGRPQETTVKVIFIDIEKRITKWSFTLIDGKTVLENEYLMVSEAKSKNYKTIKQPCLECWPKEICDSINKIKK